MEKEILEGNKLIAEFMGFQYVSEGTLNGIKGYCQHEEFASFHFDLNQRCHAKYHTSWDWLMPVVEKIGKHVYEEIEQDSKMIPDTAFMRTFHSNMARINRMALHEADTQIKATWSAVVDFIKWHNEQTITP